MLRVKQWLKQHGQAERSFSRALQRWFQEQADRVGDAAENFQGITPDNLAAIFNVDDELERFMPLVVRNLGQLMVAGAQAEYEAVGERLEPSKSVMPSDVQEWLQVYLEAVPPRTRDRIRAHLRKLAEQDYWQAIQTTVKNDLAGIVQHGIEEGVNNWQLAKAIRSQLGLKSKARSIRIARTEVGGAMNSGHNEAMADLVEAGLLKGKQWLSIADNDIRQSHLDLDGATIQPAARFNVGGFEAPHPGHWSLPAQERVNCRCAVVGVVP